MKNVYVVLSTVRLFCTSEGVPSKKNKKTKRRRICSEQTNMSLYLFFKNRHLMIDEKSTAIAGKNKNKTLRVYIKKQRKIETAFSHIVFSLKNHIAIKSNIRVFIIFLLHQQMLSRRNQPPISNVFIFFLVAIFLYIISSMHSIQRRQLLAGLHFAILRKR